MKVMWKAGKHLLVSSMLLLCLLIVPVILTGGLQAQAAGNESSQTGKAGDAFALYAAISSKTIIEPVEIPYAEGQTIRDALKNSSYQFGGIDQFYISDIQEIAGNYMIYYDGGGYDLDAPASGISGILFTEREDVDEEDVSLIRTLAAFRAQTGNVKNYVPAQNAYQEALDGLRSSGCQGKVLEDALKKAVQDYENIFKGTKYEVKLKAMQNGKELTSPVFTLVDAYGNEYETKGNSLSVVKGSYTFKVTDGGINSVEGSLQVKGASSIQAELPYGSWFSSLDLLGSDKLPYQAEVNLSKGEATFYVPDTADKNAALIYAGMGDGVPDEEATKLGVAYYSRVSEVDRTVFLSWESKTSSMTGLVTSDCQDAEFTVWGQFATADGMLQKQTMHCLVRRVPTLAKLTVNAEGTRLPLGFDPLVNQYELATVSDLLKITATGKDSAYTIKGTGSFKISENGSSYQIKVTGSNGQSNTYTVTMKKQSSVEVTVTKPSGCSLKVYNAADAEIAAVDGIYHLIPNESYYYVTTKNQEYHAKEQFKASKGLSVSAKAPETTPAMTGFMLYSDLNVKSRVAFVPDHVWNAEQRDYVYQVSDVLAAAYGQASCISGYQAKISYTSQSTTALLNGVEKTTVLSNPVDPEGKAQNIAQLLGKCCYGQSAVVTCEKAEGQITYYQEYRLNFKRILHLRELTVSDPNGMLVYSDAKGKTIDFNRDVMDYYVSVDRSTEAITLNGHFMNEQETSEICGGYHAGISGVEYDVLEEISASLDESQDLEVVELEVGSLAKDCIPSVYRIYVKKTDPLAVTFQTNPVNANVYVINNATGRHMSAVNGAYMLTPGVDYSYTVTCKGYVGQIVESYQGPEVASTVTVNLQAAAPNDSLPQYSAEWPSFRADDYNNGVVDVRTPAKAEEATLSWATQLGEGYSSDACGCPIIVDGYLYTYAMDRIYKVDSVSGEVVAYGQMDHKSSFAINSPTYAEGMIFVGLADGTVQAFNAETLESLWIYHDPLKGQPNCPIAYHDGYIYTGFWLGEATPANFVCLSATDEDPSRPLEEKLPVWRYKHNGYYWAGAYVCDDYVLIGTDDGKSGYTSGHASILSLDPLTGDLIDEYVLKETGDQRSSITFVPEAPGSQSGYGYFTTKGGYFYRIKVDADGRFSANGVKKLKLYNYDNDDANPAMSTCTPCVYNDRAYIGISGTAQFGAYSGHNITVIDLEHWSIAYTVRTQGYPQTSGLLTTAYEAETGDVLVYFFDNYTPGKLRMLRDHKGQTKPDTTVVESYTVKGEEKTYDTAYVLFTPDGNQAQYAICSPLVDKYGTIYFKNDSAYLMALTSSITKLTVVEEPDKMDYQPGELFDPTGMKVVATYANGLQRDVTQYVTWSTEAITADDTEWAIEFPYAMYQDKDGKVGSEVEHPYVSLSLNVKGSQEGQPAFEWTKTSAEDIDPALTTYAAKAVFQDQTEADCMVSSELVKEAGCETKGKLVFTATVTRGDQTYTEKKTQTLPALGHDLITVEAQEAGCETVGWNAYESCSRCDYSSYEELPALGHSWDEGVVTREATESEEGILLYTCQVCLQTREEAIPVMPHTHQKVSVAQKAATFSASGKTSGSRCSVCGKVLSGCKTIPKAGTPVLSSKSYIYDGTSKKPTVKIPVTVSGKTQYLVAGTDYTLSYQNNKLVGSASVTIKLKGKYSGSKKMTFTINPKATAITSLKPSSKAFTVTWKKISSQNSGYQIYYSTSSKMTSPKKVTVSSYKTVSKKISKLTKGKKYYVQVRTYKKVGTKTYYGKWCTKKSVTVK